MHSRIDERSKYDDIINLPHHVSATRPRMPVGDRAAQFSPFAALTGYDAAIKDTARNHRCPDLEVCAAEEEQYAWGEEL